MVLLNGSVINFKSLRFCCWIWMALTVVTPVRNEQKPCALIELTRIIPVVENIPVTILFDLKNETCSNLTNFTIEISNKVSDREKVSQHFVPSCTFMKRNGTCTDKPQVQDGLMCECRSPLGPFAFTKVFLRHDSVKWRWRNVEGFAPDVIVTFNVTYPPKVLALIVNGNDVTHLQNVPINQTIHVICNWENGYPPTRARMLDSNKIVLRETSTEGNFTYSFITTTFGCHHDIHCEADGADSISSVLLECLNRDDSFSDEMLTYFWGLGAVSSFCIIGAITIYVVIRHTTNSECIKGLRNQNRRGGVQQANDADLLAKMTINTRCHLQSASFKQSQALLPIIPLGDGAQGDLF